MDDLTAFITARLDEDEAAAYALAGTAWTAKRLGDHDYEIHVTYEPLIHAVAPTGSIADVQREDVANWIADHDPRRAQREVAAKRWLVAAAQRANAEIPGIANDHLHALAAVWSDHPGYQKDWSA